MHLLSLYITLHCSIGLALSLLSNKYTPKYLHIAGLFPVTPRDSPEGQMGLGVIPAVELALEHVNSHPRILPGIRLNLEWNDTKVSSCKKYLAYHERQNFHFLNSLGKFHHA